MPGMPGAPSLTPPAPSMGMAAPPFTPDQLQPPGMSAPPIENPMPWTPMPTRPPTIQMEEAAAALGQAQDLLAMLGQEMALPVGLGPEVKDTVLPPEQLAEAFGQAEMAAETAAAQDAALAAELLQALATAAGEVASDAGVTTGSYQYSMGGPQGDPGHKGQGTGDRAASKALIRLEVKEPKADDLWARFHGRLRDEILQGKAQAGPKEYQDLIRRYFEILAQQGREEAGGGTE